VPYAVTGTVAPSAPIKHLELILVAFLILCYYGRLLEIIVLSGGFGLHLVMPAMFLALLISILTGGAALALLSRPGIAWCLFTLWVLAGIPFSAWPGGAFNSVMSVWMKNVLFFVVLGGAATTVRECRALFRYMGIGFMLVLLSTLFESVDKEGRFSLTIGTLSNPNDLSALMLMGLPFLLTVTLSRPGILRRVLALTVMAMTAVAILRTASRAGLLTLVLMLLVVLAKASLVSKMKIVLLMPILAAIGLGLAGQARLKRVLIDFADPSERTLEMSEAIGSTQTRKQLFRQSLELTAQYPIFGVGAGMFGVVSSTYQQAHTGAGWLETHNTGTQLSSETGIPGLLIYAFAVLWCWRAVYSVYRRARGRPELREITLLAGCLLVSMMSLGLISLFGSYAYLAHYPIVTALSVGLVRCARPELDAADSRAPAYAPMYAPAHPPARGAGR
jgi:O-antigen ligase